MRFWQALFEIVAYPFTVVLRFAADLLTLPGRFFGLGLPARVALVVFAMLFATAVALLWVQSNHPQHAVWARGISFYLGTLTLLVVTPLFAYVTVKMWQEGPIAAFPEIDDAFEEGRLALLAKRIDLCDTPLYLALGAATADEADRIMAASGIKSLVNGVPSFGPIRWFGSEKGVFMFCLEASATSWANVHASRSEPRGVEIAYPELFVTNKKKSIDDGQDQPSGLLFQNTITEDGLVGRQDRMQLPPRPAELEDLRNGTAKLEHLLRKIARVRQPCCPINGLILCVPWTTLQLRPRELRTLKSAMPLDCKAIKAVAQVRYPLLVLVTETHQDAGFLELMKRKGRIEVEHGRIGKGCPSKVWNESNRDQIESLVSSACSNIISTIYGIFARPHEFSQEHGNRKLVQLIAQLRGLPANNLRDLLGNGLGSKESHGAFNLMGCYFISNGNGPEEAGFAKSVFQDRLRQDEDSLEWTEEALAADRRYLILSRVNLTVAVAMFLAICAICYLQLV